MEEKSIFVGNMVKAISLSGTKSRMVLQGGNQLTNFKYPIQEQYDNTFAKDRLKK